MADGADHPSLGNPAMGRHSRAILADRSEIGPCLCLADRSEIGPCLCLAHEQALQTFCPAPNANFRADFRCLRRKLA
jgi:hypothetical protein